MSEGRGGCLESRCESLVTKLISTKLGYRDRQGAPLAKRGSGAANVAALLALLAYAAFLATLAILYGIGAALYSLEAYLAM